MAMKIDNIIIQLREKLREKNIKLWTEPYYFDGIGSIESEIEKLAEQFSSELGISYDNCKMGLSELQDGALAKLNARKEFDETGDATFKVRVIQEGANSSSVITIKIPLTDLGSQLHNKIADTLNVNTKQIKIIGGGKVVQNDMTLMSQDLANNQQLMAMISSNESSEEESIYNRVQKAKDDVECILKSRNQEFMTVEDQDGNAVHLPPNESREIMFALALYEKGRAALKKEKYDEALVLLLEADEHFSSCNSNILNSVDNYALLNLDIVWCYLCLKSFSHLPDAQRRLEICEKNLLRSYGENMDRVHALKGDAAINERALLLRLHLLQGVLYFHQNLRNQAYEKLALADTELRSLKVDEMTLIQLMEMGYNTTEARIALRACKGDVMAAVDYITERKKKREEARNKNKKEYDMNRKLHKTDDDEGWINPRSVTTLTDMGFDRSLVQVALKKSKNNLTLALDFLQNNQHELMSEVPNIQPSSDLLNELLKLGFNEEMAKIALETITNRDQAIDLLLKMQSDGNYSELVESLNQFANLRSNSVGTSDPGAGPSNLPNPQSLLNELKKKVRKEMDAKQAYDRFTEDFTMEDDEYLDLPLVQEEIILLEYRHYLEQ